MVAGGLEFGRRRRARRGARPLNFTCIGPWPAAAQPRRAQVRLSWHRLFLCRGGIRPIVRSTTRSMEQHEDPSTSLASAGLALRLVPRAPRCRRTIPHSFRCRTAGRQVVRNAVVPDLTAIPSRTSEGCWGVLVAVHGRGGRAPGAKRGQQQRGMHPACTLPPPPGRIDTSQLRLRLAGSWIRRGWRSGGDETRSPVSRHAQRGADCESRPLPAWGRTVRNHSCSSSLVPRAHAVCAPPATARPGAPREQLPGGGHPPPRPALVRYTNSIRCRMLPPLP